MSKKSCKAAESIEDALLRMARVNSNKIHYSSFDHLRIKSTETGNAVNGWQTVQTIGSFHDYVIALYDYVMPAMLSERRLKNEQDTGLYRVDRRLYWSCQLGTDRIVPAGSGSADLWRYDVDQPDYLCAGRNLRHLFADISG